VTQAQAGVVKGVTVTKGSITSHHMGRGCTWGGRVSGSVVTGNIDPVGFQKFGLLCGHVSLVEDGCLGAWLGYPLLPGHLGASLGCKEGVVVVRGWGAPNPPTRGAAGWI
jgi:hypothetical protein